MAKQNPERVPEKSAVVLKLLSITCLSAGLYTIYVQVGARREMVVEGMQVEEAKQPCDVKFSKNVAAEVGSVDDTLTLEVFTRGKLVASGAASAFALFEDLVPAGRGSDSMFDSQILR